MLRRCAWCGKDLGEKPGPGGVTHGICPECLARELAKLKGGKTTMNSLEIGARVKGRMLFVDSWLIEKLYKVAEALAEPEPNLWEAYRNVCKLGAHFAGNISAYVDELVEEAFVRGREPQLQLLGDLLSPLLEH